MAYTISYTDAANKGTIVLEDNTLTDLNWFCTHKKLKDSRYIYAKAIPMSSSNLIYLLPSL